MGTYCTVRDVRLALTPSALETDTETAAKLPDWQIEDAILEAEGTVNAHILSRYTITLDDFEEVNPEDPGETWVFTAASSPIRGWTRDVAAYLAALTYRRNKDLGEDDPIRLRFRMVMGFLADVRDRKMSLGLPIIDTDDEGVHVENLYVGTLFGPEDFNLATAERYSMVQRIQSLRTDV